MNRVMLLLLVSISMPLAGTATEFEPEIVVLGEGEKLEHVLGIERPSATWIAVDGGMIRPFGGLAGIDPGLHDLFLSERDETGAITNARWVTVDVVDPYAQSRDAYPLTYVVDERPPRIEPRSPPFIRPTDPLPLRAYDESGIATLTYRDGGVERQIGERSTPWSVGSHTVQVRGTDRAGNETTLSLTFEVDDQPPDIVLSVSDRIVDDGAALAIRRSGEVTVEATDDYSGVAALLFRIGDDRWRGVRGPIEIDDEAPFIEFRATDEAGNERIIRREVTR